MPELPEVETVKRSLCDSIIGKEIASLTVYYGGNIRQPDVRQMEKTVVGKKFLEVCRRGKYIIFNLSQDWVLVVHLRMTGQLIYVSPEVPREKHTHLVFTLSDGHELRYVDLRKFGTFDLVPKNELKRVSGLHLLGIEPLSDQFTAEWLAGNLSKKNRAIKSVLLDQTVIAGIGNIYADEILYEAKIHPESVAGKLTPAQIVKLHQATIKLLELGISYRGTSIRNYVDGDGRQGGFQELLRVYGREGDACVRCGMPIVRTKVQGRGTYYCSNCQQKV